MVSCGPILTKLGSHHDPEFVGSSSTAVGTRWDLAIELLGELVSLVEDSGPPLPFAIHKMKVIGNKLSKFLVLLRRSHIFLPWDLVLLPTAPLID
jgi:hypothetical protein